MSGESGINCYRYEGFPLPEKFGWIRDSPGLRAVADAADTVRGMSAQLGGIGERSARDVAALDMEWRGPAADSAQRSLTATVNSASQTQQVGENGADRILDYGHSFDAMRPKIAFDDPAQYSTVQRVGDAIGESWAWAAPWLDSEDHITVNERNATHDAVANELLAQHETAARRADDSFTVDGDNPPPGAATPDGGPGDGAGAAGGMTAPGSHRVEAAGAGGAPGPGGPVTGGGQPGGPANAVAPPGPSPVVSGAGPVPVSPGVSGAGPAPGSPGGGGAGGNAANGGGPRSSSAGPVGGAGNRSGQGGAGGPAAGGPGTGGPGAGGPGAGGPGVGSAGARMPGGAIPSSPQDQAAQRSAMGQQFGQDLDKARLAPPISGGVGAGVPSSGGVGRYGSGGYGTEKFGAGGYGAGVPGAGRYGAGTGRLGDPVADGTGRRYGTGAWGAESPGRAPAAPPPSEARGWSRTGSGLPGEGVPGRGSVGETAGRSGSSSMYPPMGGGAGGGQGGQEHRNRYLTLTSEAFDVDLDFTAPVIGPTDDEE